MKKTIIGTIFGACMIAASFAADFTGIYKDPRLPDSYLSVHQNGNRIIATLYNTISFVYGSSIYYSSIAGIYYPSRADIWDLYSGTASGNFSTFGGEFNYGACNANGFMTLNFDSSITFTVTSINTTNSGIAQGVQCGRFSLGTFSMPRVF